MTRDRKAVDAIPEYEKVNRGADDLFPRDLWNACQIDLGAITEIFRTLAMQFGGRLHLNPGPRDSHPNRSLIKTIWRTYIRIELALGEIGKESPGPAPGFHYSLGVTRATRPLWHLHWTRSTWRVVGAFTPAEVRSAAPALVRAVEETVRTEFGAKTR